jgi:ligand-binding sensor domain-containing protein
VIGLPCDGNSIFADVRSLAIDPEGDFWIGTGRGLFRVARKEMQAAMDRPAEPMRYIAYGRDDGLV